MTTVQRQARSLIRRTEQRLDFGPFHEEWGGMNQSGETSGYGTTPEGRRTANPSAESTAERDARFEGMLRSLYPKRV